MSHREPGAEAEFAPNLAILGETLRTSCVELMADYGIEARPAEVLAARDSSVGMNALGSEPPASVLVAGIDFKGRQLRGTVALRAATGVIEQTTRALPGMSPDTNNLPDWTCELTNQLLGRMKKKLRAYGVSLSVNVPRLLAAAEAAELDDALRQRFSCDFGKLSASLDVLIAPGFSLNAQPDSVALPTEGDVTLF